MQCSFYVLLRFFFLYFLELLISEGEPRDVRVQRLGTRLAGLAKKYLSVPKYYPLGKFFFVFLKNIHV